jgi:tetratricopeptide (TPR) repeat protein
MKRTLIISVLVVTILAGCAQTNSKKSKWTANKLWTDARVAMLVSTAEADYRNGRMESCRERIDDALSRNAESPPLYVLAAKVAIEDGELTRARTYLDKALEADEEFAEAHWQKGLLEELVGKFPAACEQYVKAVYDDSLKPQYLLSAASMMAQLGNTDVAIELLATATSDLPGDAEIHLALADLYALQRDYAAAVDTYRQVLRLEPDNDVAQEGLAISLQASGRHEEAIDALEQLSANASREAKPAFDAQVAECLLIAGQDREAERTYAKMLVSDPQDPSARLALAHLYFRTKNDASAMEILKPLTKEFPDMSEAQALRGYLSLVSGRHAEAADHLRLAIAGAKPQDRAFLNKLLAKAVRQASDKE